jgi:hypothetical protein
MSDDERKEDEMLAPQKSNPIFTMKNVAVIIRRLAEISVILNILELAARIISHRNDPNQLLLFLTALTGAVFNITYSFVMWGIGAIIDYVRTKNEKAFQNTN